MKGFCKWTRSDLQKLEKCSLCESSGAFSPCCLHHNMRSVPSPLHSASGKSHDTGKTEQKLELIWLCCKAQFLTTWIWVVWQVPMPCRSSGFQENLWLPSGTIETQLPCHVGAHINCTSPHLTKAFPHLLRKNFSKDRGPSGMDNLSPKRRCQQIYSVHSITYPKQEFLCPVSWE